MNAWLLRASFSLFLFVAFHRTISVDVPQIYGDIFPENSRSLSTLPQGNPRNNYKCQREIPAVFFQTKKNEFISGNGSTTFFHRIEVCCEGYARSPYDWDKCVPDCSAISPNNCRNGFCRAPNKCECFEEFVLNERGECIHTCPIECENGRCFLNGTCACNPGYVLDQQHRKFCLPECPQGCGYNEECIAPGKCDCKSGYNWTIEFGCQPICTPDCGYGNCVGPNKCECFPGYTKRLPRNVCEAGCYLNCENGFCESLYKCQCWPGFKFDSQTTSCLPYCEDKCDNGVCISPGICKCFNGYVQKGGKCEPVCQGWCGFYGRCIDSNVCACVNSRQRCLMGTCDYRGHCFCKPGNIHFVDRCIDPRGLNDLINTYERKEYFNKQLRIEFENLIGGLFHFGVEDLPTSNNTT